MSLVTRGLGGPNLVTFGLGEQLGSFTAQSAAGALFMSGVVLTTFIQGTGVAESHYRGMFGTFFQHRGRG